jgi:hypothetical protein
VLIEAHDAIFDFATLIEPATDDGGGQHEILRSASPPRSGRRLVLRTYTEARRSLFRRCPR